MHPGDKIHQLQARLLEKSSGFRSSPSSAAIMAPIIALAERKGHKPALDCPGCGISSAPMRFTISLQGLTNPLLRSATMRYAAIHGRQKKVGVDGGRTHAAPDAHDISDACRGPFRTLRTGKGLASPALRTPGDVDANSGDWHDVRYVPERPRSRPDRNTSTRICFPLHLCAEWISHRPRATRVPIHDSIELIPRLRKP
jgi:hypothetical protein